MVVQSRLTKKHQPINIYRFHAKKNQTLISRNFSGKSALLRISKRDAPGGTYKSNGGGCACGGNGGMDDNILPLILGALAVAVWYLNQVITMAAAARRKRKRKRRQSFEFPTDVEFEEDFSLGLLRSVLPNLLKAQAKYENNKIVKM